jgi:type IV pilus assembly protein PilB
MENLNKMMIGQLLIQEGHIDEEQLQSALAEQARLEQYRPLGEILVARGSVSKRVLHNVILKHRKQIRLGELLVKMGIITVEQLMGALEIQGRSAKRLGQVLAERQLVTRFQLVNAICIQLGISNMGTEMGHVDKELLDKVNTAFLRKRRVVPLRYTNDNRVLMVLMEDPTDGEAIADLEKMFRAEIEPVMLRDGSIDQVLGGILDIWSSFSR